MLRSRAFIETPMNANIERKRKAERRLVERAQALCPWFPQGVLVGGDKPDVVIETDADRIGVEVTQLLEADAKRAPSRPKVASFHRDVVSRAWTMYQAAGLPPVDVLTYFGDEPLSDARETARSLFEFVASRYPAGTSDCHKWMVPEGFSVIRIARPFTDTPRWHTGEGGSVPGVERSLVERVIREKNTRIAAYRTKVDRVWLLIATSLSFEGSFWVPRDVEEWTFPFDFERVVLYSAEDGRLFNLRRTANN